MLKLGIIGTNGISDGFADAIQPAAAYELHSILSRSLDKAEKFAQKYGEHILAYDSLESFLDDEALDVVYIATPNGLHYAEAKAALEAKKHVIVEKPAFSNPSEMTEIIKVAQTNGVYFFEAIRTLYNDGFRAIQDFLAGKTVLGADFRFISYDYRMPEVLAGGDPPSFSAKYSGGTLTDIGVYLLYPTLRLFGLPAEVSYSAKFLPTGVDGNGTALLDYGDFQVSFELGRNIQTCLAQSEIYLQDGTLLIDSFANFENITWFPHQGEVQSLSFEKKQNSMTDQALLFAEVIRTADTEKFDRLTLLTRQVNDVMYKMRQRAGIHFLADEKDK
ncbi:Gfo/Idh/MocA family protein [Lactovum odontotermitis]